MKKILLYLVIAAIVIFLLIQLVPFGHDHTNPARNGATREQAFAKGKAIGVKVEAVPTIIHRPKDFFLILDGTQIPIAIVEMDGQLALHDWIGHRDIPFATILWGKYFLYIHSQAG